MIDWLYRRLLGPASKGRLIILTYHRVLEAPDPLLPGEPCANAFARQVDWLRSHMNVMALSDAVDALREGTLPPRAVCITFDDGYANNLTVAAPILQEAGLPATFFVTTSDLETGAMWNDVVIEALRNYTGSYALPGAEDVSIDDTQRRKTIHATLDQIKYLPHGERAELAARMHAELAGGPPPRLMMTPQQVAELARIPGMSVGGHTCTHPILGNLDLASAQAEIAQNRAELLAMGASELRAFAYPNGKPGRDFSARDQEIVRACDYACAVSTEWAAATRNSDAFALPRISLNTDRSSWAEPLLRTYVRSWLSS